MHDSIQHSWTHRGKRSIFTRRNLINMYFNLPHLATSAIKAWAGQSSPSATMIPLSNLSFVDSLASCLAFSLAPGQVLQLLNLLESFCFLSNKETERWECLEVERTEYGAPFKGQPFFQRAGQKMREST
jgi:hypothetical protein